MIDISNYSDYSGTDVNVEIALFEYEMLWKKRENSEEEIYDFVLPAAKPGHYFETWMLADDMTFENFNWASRDDLKSYSDILPPERTPEFINTLVSYHGVINVFGDVPYGERVIPADELGLQEIDDDTFSLITNEEDARTYYIKGGCMDGAYEELEVGYIIPWDGDLEPVGTAKDLDAAMSLLEVLQGDELEYASNLKEEREHAIACIKQLK